MHEQIRRREPPSLRRFAIMPVVLCAILSSAPLPAQKSQAPGQPNSSTPRQKRDGQHDFDFNLGTWKTHVSRLAHPLSGFKKWLEYDGVSHVNKVWDGHANIFELEVDGPAGHIEGMGLRLYNPQTQQWSLNWASSSDGTLQPPMVGGFNGGRGEFVDVESFNGNVVLVRNSFFNITADSSRFEQAFSPDGGKTWEVNWVITFARMKDGSDAKSTASIPPSDWQHDFDWEFGTWKLHVSRLQSPLTGSDKWIELNGTVKVRPIWNGRANLAEIAVDGPTGHIEFLSLRLYNPQSHQWSMSFATDGDGTLSVPMIGSFDHGRGEFYDQEPFKGRAILVRFVFSALTPDSGRSEQAFSPDGGKTWEVNWINTYTRVSNTSQ